MISRSTWGERAEFKPQANLYSVSKSANLPSLPDLKANWEPAGMASHYLQSPAVHPVNQERCCSALGQHTNTTDIQLGVTLLELLTFKVTSDWHQLTVSFDR